MSDGLNRLGNCAIRLVNASFDFREHCCEFSRFLVVKTPDEDWPDVAEQLLFMLSDVDMMAKECMELASPYRAQLAKTVAELKLPKPDSHLSWLLWTAEHWSRQSHSLKVNLRIKLSCDLSSDADHYWRLGVSARQQPEKCKDVARMVMAMADSFVMFDNRLEIIERIKVEVIGVDATCVQPVQPTEHPLHDRRRQLGLDMRNEKKSWREVTLRLDGDSINKNDIARVTAEITRYAEDTHQAIYQDLRRVKRTN